jgi:nanoRNase/pAp phosphatase (c-di-AMP/oligoRNAs hydrolase)
MVASVYGGGGHKNAAGFTVEGSFAEVKPPILARLVQAIRVGLQTRPGP